MLKRCNWLLEENKENDVLYASKTHETAFVLDYYVRSLVIFFDKNNINNKKLIEPVKNFLKEKVFELDNQTLSRFFCFLNHYGQKKIGIDLLELIVKELNKK